MNQETQVAPGSWKMRGSRFSPRASIKEYSPADISVLTRNIHFGVLIPQTHSINRKLTQHDLVRIGMRPISLDRVLCRGTSSDGATSVSQNLLQVRAKVKEMW
jgi:hypothetical protein